MKIRNDTFLEYQSDCPVDSAPVELSVLLSGPNKETIKSNKEKKDVF